MAVAVGRDRRQRLPPRRPRGSSCGPASASPGSSASPLVGAVWRSPARACRPPTRWSSGSGCSRSSSSARSSSASSTACPRPTATTSTIATGMIALVVGFGFWWIYFDLVGRRLPRNEGGPLVTWMLSHLPITLSIAAAGAAMVSLIGHAGDDRTPAGHRLAARRRRRPRPALADRHRADARRRRAPRRRLPAAAGSRWRRGRRRPGRRLGPPGALAARAAPRRDPHGGLALRRQPLPAHRRLAPLTAGASRRVQGVSSSSRVGSSTREGSNRKRGCCCSEPSSSARARAPR